MRTCAALSSGGLWGINTAFRSLWGLTEAETKPGTHIREIANLCQASHDKPDGWPLLTSAITGFDEDLDAVLQRVPKQRHQDLVFIQIAPPSREDVDSYQAIRAELEQKCGRINGARSEVDMVPIRYVNRGYSHEELFGFFRTAKIGLVTPLRDGMNLVAKEYVAAQRGEDPGVVVLSRFAGAAEGMPEAVIVNPYSAEGVAGALQTALNMPLDERRDRWQAIFDRIQENAKAEFIFARANIILEFEGTLTKKQRANPEWFPTYLQVLVPTLESDDVGEGDVLHDFCFAHAPGDGHDVSQVADVAHQVPVLGASGGGGRPRLSLRDLRHERQQGQSTASIKRLL